MFQALKRTIAFKSISYNSQTVDSGILISRISDYKSTLETLYEKSDIKIFTPETDV